MGFDVEMLVLDIPYISIQGNDQVHNPFYRTTTQILLHPYNRSMCVLKDEILFIFPCKEKFNCLTDLIVYLAMLIF